MRTATLRTLAGSLSVAALAALVSVAPSHGQVAPIAAPDAPEGAKKEKNAPLEVMIFPSDRDAKNMIKAVNDYLEEFKEKKEKAPWDKICFAAQQVLDAKSDSFYEAKTEDGKVQRISAKAEANRLIGRFPQEGKQFYQLTFGGTADGLLNDAVGKNYDRTVLAEVSQRYFHTKAGAQAALLLAGLHLDRGNYVESAYSFERLLDRKDAEEFFTPLTTFKAIVALQRAGQSADKVKKLTDQLEKKYPRDGLKIGRRTYSFDDLKDELAKSPETLFGKVGDAYVTMRLGNASHTGVGDGGAPFLDPAYTRSMTTRTEDFQEGAAWIQQNLTDVVKGVRATGSQQVVAIPGFFPVSAQNLVFVRTYDGIFAYVTKDGFSNHGKPAKAGDLYWYADAKGALAAIMSADNNADAKARFQQYKDSHKLKTILFDNPLVGSMTHDGQNVYAVDDTALPSPPAVYDPNMGFMPVNPGAGGQMGVDKLFAEGNRLVALNMLTGNLAWQLGNAVSVPAMTEEEEDKTDNPLLLMANAFFVGPPLPVNGKLYVLFEKNGRMRLACLDPLKVKHYQLPNGKPSDKAPELVWSQRLGEPNMKLPLDSVRRFQCSYLAYSEGVMICPTNAGAVVAVDVMSRSLLWARSYRSLEQPAAGQENMGGRRFVRGGQPPNTGLSALAADHYRAAAPVVSNGRVVFTAFDSKSIDCLDLRTGDLLWTEPQRAGDLYVGGVVADKVVVVGKEFVRAINLVGKPREKAGPTGKEDTVMAWRDLRVGTPAGHGVVSKGGVYYLPLANSPDGDRPEIWAINVAKGTVTAKAAYRKKAEADGPPVMLGNLAFHEGQLLAQSPLELAVFPLTGLKKAEMDKLLAANPKDPVGLVARGEISMDNGEIAAAIADFKEAAKNNPPEDAQRRLREKLYAAYTELLRKDFTAGESFLDEYKGLTEVKVDSDDPKVKQQQIDEGFNRRKTFLELMANGRRQQKRLAEAFDHYVEISKLGDNKQLISIGSETNGQTRPDVWARGQISAMIEEATDPAVRKPLEDRVAKEWAAVQKGADPKALAEFVRAFGDHFAVGREAQLALAEKKLAANNDDDAREAQALLLKVWATAPEKRIVARAIETLARLMTRRGMMDDAVALYAKLGEEYPDVSIRDGKTGADFLNDLLTDKRLLPYLEPMRIPTPDRVKVNEVRGGAAGGYNTITVEPDGAETNAFYQRHRLMLMPNNAGDGTWALKVYDRSTNQEKATFPRLRFYAQTGVPQHRIAQAHGNLLLVHTGLMVHCFDLAEKKQLWEFNPLGDLKLDPNRNNYYDGNPIPEMDVTVPLGQDGTKLGVGRATVLEANVACVVWKDGLIGLDPMTGAKLWSRTNVGSNSVVFGDSQHVFVVEKNNENRPTRSRAFRAADGKPVDTAPDCSGLVTGDALVRFVGRHLLVTDVKEKQRHLRLYDPLTGQDVWSKGYPADAAVLHSHLPEVTGAIKADGAFEVLAIKTGKPVFAGQIDKGNAADHAKDLVKPVLLGDGERFYLVLNKAGNANAGRNYNYMYLKFLPVNGAVYCFDRASGTRLWYTDKLFLNQHLLIDRFADVPALVAGTQMQSDDGTGQWIYRVIVLDKANGRLRYYRNLSQNGYFYSLVTDPKNATAKVIRGDMYWEISPDDGKAPAGERKVNAAVPSTPTSGPASPVPPPVAVPKK
jgi:outer membrane protein assembly factor BamB